MIGTNQYPNLQEKMLGQISERENAANQDKTETKYKKIKISRGAAIFEKIRLGTESYIQQGNKQPCVFLLTIGNLAMSKARATFAANFFGCAGFRITDAPGFVTVVEGIRAALESEAGIVVICSSDEEYPTFVPAICTGIKRAKPNVKLILAGYPKEMLETYKDAGIDDFIHIRSNVGETLQKFQQLLGII